MATRCCIARFAVAGSDSSALPDLPRCGRKHRATCAQSTDGIRCARLTTHNLGFTQAATLSSGTADCGGLPRPSQLVVERVRHSSHARYGSRLPRAAPPSPRAARQLAVGGLRATSLADSATSMHRCTSRDVRTPVPPPRCQIRWTDRLYARTDGGCNQRGERQPPRGTWRVLLSPAPPALRLGDSDRSVAWREIGHSRNGQASQAGGSKPKPSLDPHARTHARAP